MRVLVHPVDLEIGGSEINAIDLAAAVRDRGHDVIVYSRPGPLRDLVFKRKLRHIEAHFPARPRPSPVAVWELRKIVREEQIDLVHAYEGYSCVEALYGARLCCGTPTLGTLYTMTVDRYLPRSIPMIAGTPELQRELRREPARARRGIDIPMLHPPIDVHRDVPSVDATSFRQRWGLDAGSFLIVIVSRLDIALKLEGLSDAIRAVTKIADRTPIQLVIVGDGPARAALAEQAAEVNVQLGTDIVILTGAIVDPRPAYAAADLVIGQGTSALRALSMEKPVIVAGERGFYQLVSPDSLSPFLERGFWGVGNGKDGTEILVRLLLDIVVMDKSARRALGSFGRKLVVEKFSLVTAGMILARIYDSCIQAHGRTQRRGAVLTDAVGTALRVARFKFERRIDKYRGIDEERTRQLTQR